MNDELERWDKEFDGDWQLAGQVLKSPGYHTRLPDGIRVHSTLANLDYAFALLARGPERHARALRIVDAVLALQELRPTARTYGIWPWFFEESLPDMAPPDWNYADFCGARLADILHRHSGKLGDERLARTRAALGHAAWSIFRRNINPEYTNIAVMGATVTLAAGEILDEPRLRGYARARFEDFVRHTERHGSFNEYNSPTYTVIAIEECERALRLGRDAVARAHIEAIRRKGWEIVAEHFHAPTFEWGGPQYRTYHDRLPRERVAWLRARLDCPPDHPNACPPEWRPSFERLDGVTWARPVYAVDEAGGPRTAGAVWRSPDACLGSVNRGTCWTQSRPVLGYWKSGGAAAAVFRLRYLKDGRDFASAVCQNAQDHERLLTRVSWALDQGDFHPGLDRPARPVFSGMSWRLRYSLDADDAAVAVQPWGFTLTSGAMRVDLAPARDGRFAGEPVTWRCGGENGLTWVDAITHEGASRTVDLAADPLVRLAAACRITRRDAPETALEPPHFNETAVTWDALSIPLED